MPRKKTSVSKVTYSVSSLALSELHIRLETLEEEHKAILKKIKKKQTEIKNFVEQMRSIASQMFTKVSPCMQRIADLDREIHQLFDEILTTRKLGIKSKKTIEEIYENLQEMGLISYKIDNDDEDIELDEMFETSDEEDREFANQNRQKYSYDNQQHETASANKSETSRKIRQTFLKLAEIFHPDKVTDNETQMRHNEIMKEINKAYQEGDIAKLLEIEKQYKLGEIVDINSEDDLTRKCERIEEQNNTLKTQYDNLKRELRQVKNTPEGAIVADYRKAVKQGTDLFEDMIEEIEVQINYVEEVRNFVLDFRDKKITIQKFLKGPSFISIKQKMMEEMMEKMMQEMAMDWD